MRKLFLYALFFLSFPALAQNVILTDRITTLDYTNIKCEITDVGEYLIKYLDKAGREHIIKREGVKKIARNGFETYSFEEFNDQITPKEKSYFKCSIKNISDTTMTYYLEIPGELKSIAREQIERYRYNGNIYEAGILPMELRDSADIDQNLINKKAMAYDFNRAGIHIMKGGRQLNAALFIMLATSVVSVYVASVESPSPAAGVLLIGGAVASISFSISGGSNIARGGKILSKVQP